LPRSRAFLLPCFFALLLLACRAGSAGSLPTATDSATPLPPATFTALPTATAPPTATSTSTPSPTPTSSPTPDPYTGLTIADLLARSYGGGELRTEETLEVNSAFTRYLVSYPSDGLTIYGFMNVPHGEGAFPVVLVLHGYVDPDIYQVLTYTTRYTDALARAGFLVIHPNYRGYPPSDDGPNAFRVGFAIDVLNLAALVRQQAGRPGPLEIAAPSSLGLLGHSMGGGITLRVLTVDPQIQAAVLYGSMSADEQQNFEKIFEWSDGQRGQEELETPAEDLLRISPIFYLDRIQASLEVHHGGADAVAPPAWSVDLCQRLQTLGKRVACFTYPGQPHTFTGDGDTLFLQRVIEFLTEALLP